MMQQHSLRAPRRQQRHPRRPPVLAAALLLVALASAVTPRALAAPLLQQQAAPVPVRTLLPFQQLTGQLTDLDDGVAVYRLAALKPGTAYEVRVSFPASIPATLKFALVDAPTAAAVAAARRADASLWAAAGGGSRRRLLDCEKLLFETEGASNATRGLSQPHLLLRAVRRSVHRDGPAAGARQLVFNIVLAELLWPHGLPLDNIPPVLTIVLLLVAAFFWSLYWSHSLFPRLLAALTGATSSSSSSTDGGASSTATAATVAATKLGSSSSTPPAPAAAAALSRGAAAKKRSQ